MPQPRGGRARAGTGLREGRAEVAPEGTGDTLMAAVRVGEGGAGQCPVTGELRDDGHEVERREVEAVWVKPQVTRTELGADSALSRRSDQRFPRGLCPPGFCCVLGESHDSHWKGKFPTLVVADSSLEAPNLPWVGIEMIDK